MSTMQGDEIKVAMVTHSYYPNIGGVEKHVQRLSEELAKTMHIEVFTIAHTLPQMFTRDTLNGVFINRFKSRRLTYGIEIPSSLLLDKLLDYKPEIIHLHNLHTLLPPTVVKATQELRCKLVITPHYHGQSQSAFRNQLLKVYRRSLSKALGIADKVICVSEFEKALILRNFALDSARITVISNAVDFEKATLHSPEDRDMSKLLYVGKLEKYKNVDKIVESLPLLPAGKQFRLTIVGDGPERESVFKLIKKLKLEDVVVMKRNLSKVQLNDEYEYSGMFIFPSHFEAYGIVVAEALNFGMRVIVADTSALSDFVKNGYARGIQLPVTAEKIADAVIQCAEGSISAIQFPYVSWDMVAKKVEQEYTNILSPGSRI